MRSLTELLEMIDSLDIYEKDYETILKIIDLDDPEFAAAVIEEVLEGNLYWSDFEDILPSEYRDIISNTIPKQSEMGKEIERLINFREWTDLSSYEKISKISSIGVPYFEGNVIYAKNYSEMRDDMLYQLMQPTYNSLRASDYTLELALKTKLYNMIENGRYVYIDKEGNLPAGYTLKDGRVVETTANGSEIEYPYINPNDLLFSADQFILPVDWRYQELLDVDLVFMAENGMSEEQIKKMKSVVALIKSGSAYIRIPSGA